MDLKPFLGNSGCKGALAFVLGASLTLIFLGFSTKKYLLLTGSKIFLFWVVNSSQVKVDSAFEIPVVKAKL